MVSIHMAIMINSLTFILRKILPSLTCVIGLMSPTIQVILLIQLIGDINKTKILLLKFTTTKHLSLNFHCAAGEYNIHEKQIRIKVASLYFQ